MIGSSDDYKKHILRTAAWLAKGISAREPSLLKLERELFLSFYYVRKLIEANKISDSLLSAVHHVSWHPITGKVSTLNWHNLNKLINFAEQSAESKDLEFLCNRFIHSFIFVPSIEKNKVSDILIATDRDRSRDKKLFRVPLTLLVALLTEVGNDCPAYLIRVLCENGQFETWLGDSTLGNILWSTKHIMPPS